MDKQKVAKAILKLAKELVSKTVKKASIKTAERMTVNGVKVWISTGGNIRAEVSESHIELLLDALKVKGKLRNIKKLDIYDAKMRGQNIEFVSADATTADRKILDFTATIIQSGSKSKVRIDSLELESENELSDGALAFVEEFGEAAEDILSDMDYGMCDVDDFDKSGFTPGAYDLKLDGEEYLGFKDSDDAETEAIRQVREDLENASELFNQRWLMGFIDESNAESFFRGVYDDLNNGYVDDIKNEDSRSGYGSRFDDELVDRGIVEEEDIIWTEDDPYIPDDEDEAELLIGTVKENWDSSDHIDEFVEQMTQDQIDEGQGGYNYYESIFGADNALKIIKEYDLIDLDSAADNAISTDGVAHFLSSYDGIEIEGNDGSVWYRKN